MTHFLVLEYEVAFDLGWLTTRVFTYSASGSRSLSFVVYEGFPSVFSFHSDVLHPEQRLLAQSPF